MKTIAFIILIALPVFANAQESQLNSFFEKYSGKDGYTSVYITKYMFELFTKIDAEKKDKDLDEVLTKLKSIKILTIDSVTNLKTNLKFGKELLTVLPKNIYKELMIVKDGRQTITFMIREDGSKISEFVMTVDGLASPVLIYLEGDINLKHISKLSKSMKIDGFEHLEKIDEKK
jgi:CRISPR/Cas system-associated protein endoribonuclease Cas2